MQENQNESALRLIVTGTRRDGRQSKQALVKACLQPGVSLAGMALKHGINANLLHKWVVRYQLACNAAALPLLQIPDDADVFVPLILNRGTATPVNQHRDIPMRTTVQKAAPVNPPPHLRAQLTNGVTLDFNCTDRDTVWLSAIIKTLMRCDVSPQR